MGDFGYIFGYTIFFTFLIGGLVGYFIGYFQRKNEELKIGSSWKKKSRV